MTEETKEKTKEDIVKTLIDELKDAKQDIELLKNIADKKRLSLYYQRNKQKLPTYVNLRMIDKKIILGWQMIQNEVYLESASRKWIENQVVKVIYEDGTTKTMSLLDFNLNYVYVKCRRTGILTDETTGNVAFKLIREDNGKEYTVGVEYVN